MDWSRIKSIFIITFLLLNTFLAFQLMEKINASDINVRVQATVNEMLADMNISVTEELPEEREAINHIVGQPKEIVQEVEWITESDDEIHVLNDAFIEVVLDEPYAVSDVAQDVRNFLEEHIWNGEEYVYASWDSELRQMKFNQTYQNSTVVTSDESPLVLFFNENNEIEGYVQSYLVFEEEGKEKDMLPPYKAIEVLLNEGILSFNDQVTSVQLGYYSLFSPSGYSHVFAPMYNIKINDDSSYLVHAIDGSVQDSFEVEEEVTNEGETEEQQIS